MAAASTTTTSTTTTSITATADSSDSDSGRSNTPSVVAVAGATGRTGRLVVEELVRRKKKVVALVRDMDKAKEVLLSDTATTTVVNCVQCNLLSSNEMENALKECDAVIWCATGFSDAPNSSIFEKVKLLFNIAVTPKSSVDIVGVPAMANIMKEKRSATETENTDGGPNMVLLSSAGVTRSSWEEEKKAMFEGAADIPIVRLNPFGILDIKAESEEKLRETGADYCIVRPCGLNDSWPANSRPILSQGDVAVGRMNRKDVATLLVDVLDCPSAVGKTFEAVTLSGYAPGQTLDKALSRLNLDKDGIPSNIMLQPTYNMMQQLLPGETQDAAALAMGQTYEELDKGKTGRLGERGTEDAESAAPKPSS